MEVWLRSIQGKRLQSVMGLFHEYEADRDRRAQQFCFVVDTLQPFKLFGGGDGVSIRMSEQCMSEVDMQEFGRMVRLDISQSHPFSQFISKKISSVAVVISNREEATIGVVINFDGRGFSILNLGDEFYIYDEIPKEILAEEKLSIVLVG